MILLAGCENQIVLVQYDSATSAIICHFLMMTNTSKSCEVTYGQCDKMMSFTQRNSTLNIIMLDINPNDLECYTVTASSDGFSVVVEGQRLTSSGISMHVFSDIT